MADYTITGANGFYRRDTPAVYPLRTRDLTDTDSKGKDVKVPVGTSGPDFLRLFYPGCRPEIVDANFPFAMRDNKDRKYTAIPTDRFVFRDGSGATTINRHAKEQISCLLAEWTALGFPTVQDDDRQLVLPDYSFVWDALRPQHPLHAKVMAHRKDIAFIVSTVDIIKKYSIVRTVDWGWQFVSYAGKDTEHFSAFAKALSACEGALRVLASSGLLAGATEAVLKEASDPQDTNPGYPYFTTQLDTAGRPINRIRAMEKLRNLRQRALDYYQTAKVANPDLTLWRATLRVIDNQFGATSYPGHPLAIAAIRRLSPGYGWNHVWTRTETGLRTSHDQRGTNKQRVAWMVPHIYNVLVAPFHALIKGFRNLLPGCNQSGPVKQARMQRLAKQPLLTAESDYSNYDRNIPVNLVEAITDMLAQYTTDPAFYREMGMYLHYDASVVLPDYLGPDKATTVVFKPGKAGLFSGVKLTAETGTLVNFVINLQALIDSESWSVQEAQNYILGATTAGVDLVLHARRNSGHERFLIASDDNYIIAPSISQLHAQGLAFDSLAKRAGLKSEVFLGTRFLMRDMIDGRDLPVVARVYQNTISNETPPEDELIFDVGFASRSDGLFGLKTIDPFSLGHTQPVSKLERQFTRLVLTQLRELFTKAAQVPAKSLRLVDSLISYGDGNSSVSKDIHELRRAIISELAARELSKVTAVDSYIAALLRDRHKPSVELMLTEIFKLHPELEKQAAANMAKDHEFFLYCAQALGFPLRIYRM